MKLWADSDFGVLDTSRRLRSDSVCHRCFNRTLDRLPELMGAEPGASSPKTIRRAPKGNTVTRAARFLGEPRIAINDWRHASDLWIAGDIRYLELNFACDRILEFFRSGYALRGELDHLTERFAPDVSIEVVRLAKDRD